MRKNIKKLKRDNYKVLLENPIKNKRDDIIGFDSEIKRFSHPLPENFTVYSK